MGHTEQSGAAHDMEEKAHRRTCINRYKESSLNGESSSPPGSDANVVGVRTGKSAISTTKVSTTSATKKVGFTLDLDTNEATVPTENLVQQRRNVCH